MKSLFAAATPCLLTLRIALCIGVLWFCHTAGKAQQDSTQSIYALDPHPLAAVDLAKYYDDLPQVQQARTQDTLTRTLFDYLVDPKQPLDHRLAVVWALGQPRKGYSHRHFFNAFYQQRFGKSYQPQDAVGAEPQVAIIAAFLTAQDSPLDVDKQAYIMQQATIRLYKCETAQVMTVVMWAQRDFEAAPCWVWRDWISVLGRRKNLKQDKLRPEAFEAIARYFQTLAVDCRD